MEQRFLIDTNIIIYYANGTIPIAHFEKVSKIFRESFLISTITQIEVLGWHRLSAIGKESLERFMSNAQVIYIDSFIEAKAIEIKQLQKIATPDAIIAATAICYQLTLVSRNKKDFDQVRDLQLYNPFE